MDERRQKVRRLKRQVERGDYGVDPRVVADAVLARLRAEQTLGTERCERYEGNEPGGEPYEQPQTECSYPRNSGRAESVKRTLGRPARTWPIQLNSSSQLRAAASARLRAVGGTQTQSS